MSDRMPSEELCKRLMELSSGVRGPCKHPSIRNDIIFSESAKRIAELEAERHQVSEKFRGFIRRRANAGVCHNDNYAFEMMEWLDKIGEK